MRLLISGDVARDPSTGGEPRQGAPPGGAPAFGLRFEVLAPIAVGSTARVDLCRSQGPEPGALATPGASAGQLIAVKRPLPELVRDDNVGKRFLDEVWMTAALRHPNVVSVVGWGTDGLGPYLAVELVQGVSLARLMKSVFDTGEQFSERLIVYVGLCTARGLSAAHELVSDRGELLQLVHRDLSAANVLVGFSGEVKIADFGVAKAKDRLMVTTSDLPHRSVVHVSPEELSQGTADHRSDIFSLGVMLFELVSGRLPFRGKDELSTLDAVVKKPAPDLVKLRPKMDRAIARLVARCLEKDPAARPQSAREVARELEHWLDLHGHRHDNAEVLARFVRRNSMRQMRWFERVIAGTPAPERPPFKPAMQSLYDMARDRQDSHASMDSSGLPTTQRHEEPTMVEGPKPRPVGFGRRRSADNLALLARTRRLSNPGDVGTEAPVFIDQETEDDVPTVALKISREEREALKQGTHQGVGRRGPRDTAYLEGADQGGQLSPLTRRIEVELDVMVKLSQARHERARLAREAAKNAAVEAERREAAARQVDRAIDGARQALDAALRGASPEEVEQQLEAALALLSEGADRPR